MLDRLIARRYALQDELGVGGMGTVYRALDNTTHQLVAVKHLKSHLTQPDMMERFKREGETLRDLNHPNIVKMLDAIEENGNHYLVMEYVAGGDLAALVHRGALPVERTLKLAIDLADALTRAHKLNIVHRDLKPANVLIGTDDVLRLTDFGVAHVGTKVRMTEADTIVGTMDYLPPEVFNGGAADVRGDIWAFGVILFEILTGQRPFSGASLSATITAILTAPLPDLEALAPQTPTDLVDLVYRMLERDPNARISSIRYIGAALEDILHRRDTQAHLKRFDTPASDVLSLPKHNLPSQTSPFVGREHELDEIAKLLGNSAQRLVTIVAPGGMGKTRLALETATRQLASFRHGVYFVDLTTLTHSQGIISTIAEAVTLTFNDEDNLSPKQQLLGFLATKHMLLVIDNWDDLIDGAGLVSDILRVAPEVQILATSRRRLEQVGEVIFHLSGMDFPQWETPADAMEFAAMKLYVNSALRAQPAFEVTTENLNSIARTCRLVAGMPLGIVLAASWLATLSPAEIATEIETSIDFLEATSGEVPDRQRSIRVVFDYTWQQMSADEQQVFMRMSVFQGGFTRQAAQTVTDATLRHLMSLVNKSLIRRNVEDGRYSIHALLRQYAKEQLESHLEAYHTAQLQHSRYYLQTAAATTVGLKGAWQKRAFEEMRADFENIKQAWLYAVEQGDSDLLTQSVEAIQIYSGEMQTPATMHEVWQSALEGGKRNPKMPRYCLLIHTKLAETDAEVHELLEIANATQDATLLRMGYSRLRLLHFNRRAYQEGLEYSQKALQAAIQENDPYYLGLAHYDLCFFYGLLGEQELQRHHLMLSYQMLKEVDNVLGLTFPLGAMATLAAVFEGEYRQKYDYDTEAFTISLQFGQNRGMVFQLSMLTISSLLLGRLDEARSWLAKGTTICETFNDSQNIGAIEAATALVACLEKRYEAAQSLAEACIKRVSNRAILGFALVAQAWAAAGLHDKTLATRIRQGIFFAPLKNPEQLPYVTIFLVSIAQLRKLEGQLNYAAEICSLALHHPKSTLDLFQILPLMRELIAELKQTLPKDDFEAAWERGKNLEYAPVVGRFLQEHAAT